MTLHKAIEAAREALKMASDNEFPMAKGKLRKSIYDQALSTIPAKPMSEEEVATKIRDILIENVDDSSSVLNVVTYDIIRALRDIGVLYCSEE